MAGNYPSHLADTDHHQFVGFRLSNRLKPCRPERVIHGGFVDFRCGFKVTFQAMLAAWIGEFSGPIEITVWVWSMGKKTMERNARVQS